MSRLLETLDYEKSDLSLAWLTSILQRDVEMSMGLGY